jgi:hypothetical protein
VKKKPRQFPGGASHNWEKEWRPRRQRRARSDRLQQSEGTAVYNRAGEHLGKVYNFMVNKRSGQVEYAVLSFGGFLAGVFEPQRLHAALEQRSRKAYASSAHAGLSMAAPQEPC